MMFKNIHNWPLEHWHIELCSKCSLKCPRCSRQEVPEGLVNRDLSLSWFQKNFTGKLLKQVKKLTVTSQHRPNPKTTSGILISDNFQILNLFNAVFIVNILILLGPRRRYGRYRDDICSGLLVFAWRWWHDTAFDEGHGRRTKPSTGGFQARRVQGRGFGGHCLR